jgi:hypothetical protein
MREKRHGPRRANGVRPTGVRTSAVPLHDPDLADTDVFEPIDLVAVQTDDELINTLSAGFTVSGPGGFGGGFGPDDRVAAVLAAWKAEVDAEPFPELVDLDTAVAAVRAARPRSARFRPSSLRTFFLRRIFVGVISTSSSLSMYSSAISSVIWRGGFRRMLRSEPEARMFVSFFSLQGLTLMSSARAFSATIIPS